MFTDGFHNTVDVFKPQFGSSRIDKSESKYNDAAEFRNVKCRIYKDKIFFDIGFKIKKGWKVVSDKDIYIVKDVKEVYSLKGPHHITAFVEKRVL